MEERERKGGGVSVGAQVHRLGEAEKRGSRTLRDHGELGHWKEVRAKEREES